MTVTQRAAKDAVDTGEPAAIPFHADHASDRASTPAPQAMFPEGDVVRTSAQLTVVDTEGP